MDDEKPPLDRLRLIGMRRIGVDPEPPHDILLSFLDATGKEHWIQFPRNSAGIIAASVVEAAKTAADRAGSGVPTLSVSEQKLISEGMKLTGFTVRRGWSVRGSDGSHRSWLDI